MQSFTGRHGCSCHDEERGKKREREKEKEGWKAWGEAGLAELVVEATGGGVLEDELGVGRRQQDGAAVHGRAARTGALGQRGKKASGDVELDRGRFGMRGSRED